MAIEYSAIRQFSIILALGGSVSIDLAKVSKRKEYDPTDKRKRIVHETCPTVQLVSYTNSSSHRNQSAGNRPQFRNFLQTQTKPILSAFGCVSCVKLEADWARNGHKQTNKCARRYRSETMMMMMKKGERANEWEIGLFSRVHLADPPFFPLPSDRT